MFTLVAVSLAVFYRFLVIIFLFSRVYFWVDVVDSCR